MDLADFEDRIWWASRHMDGEAFSAPTAEHGRLVVERLFAKAKRTVHILGGSLDSRIYASNHVLSSARQFLSVPDVRLRILLDVDRADARRKHPFLQMAETFPDKVSLGILSTPVADLVDLHFVVADDDSYRVKPRKQSESSIVAFGDKEGAENLVRIFSAFGGTPNIHFLEPAEMAA